MADRLRPWQIILAVIGAIFIALFIVNSPWFKLSSGKTAFVMADITEMNELEPGSGDMEYHYQYRVNDQLYVSYMQCGSCPNAAFKKPEVLEPLTGKPAVNVDPKWVRVEYLVKDPKVNRIRAEKEKGRS